jgi:predicted membrane-bound dolichyl-phosphate-mannose-protein mannosyltransferase
MAKTRESRTRLTRRPAPGGGPVADPDPVEAPRRPDRAPGVVVVLVLLVLIASATVRLYELQRPAVFVFDEVYYAKDAHAILQGALAGTTVYPWEPGKEISWPHPEYGKYAIAAGEAAFGYDSFGWRIVAAIVGTLLLCLVYPIARRLGLPPVWALLGLALAASDFLGIVQSRIATLDIFVAFWSVLCVYLALRYVQSGHRTRWLALCGLAGGFALGTKWSGAFAIAAAAAYILLHRRRPADAWRRWPWLAAGVALVVAGGAFPALGVPAPGLLPHVSLAIALAIAGIVALEVGVPDVRRPSLALAALPAGLYFASYVDYFAVGHHTLSQWWQLQQEMWWFNETLHATHTYASRAYTWIFDYRPVWYYYEQIGGRVHGIISIGNPLLWWGSIAALVGLVVLAVRRRDRELAVLPITVALLYLPWLRTTRTSFMYYMTPVAPFMALAVAAMLRELSATRLPRWQLAAACYAAACVVVALFWYQIGVAADWLFWRDPATLSTDLARVTLAVGITIAVLVVLGLFFWGPAKRVWPYLTWVYAGAVTGVCLAFLPILIDLPITISHFYHLMWFRNWI